MDSRVLLAEVRESEDWSPVTNSRSLGVDVRVELGGWGWPWGGDLINKHKTGGFLEN